MPGKRDRNLRSGNIHEDLGVLLLRPVALIAPVPMWEDVGLDAAATLLRPDGGRRLIPEDSFGIQLKASSVREVIYEDEGAANWVVSLGLPFFIGSVQLSGAIDLYPTHNLFKVCPHAGLREVRLHLDVCDEHFGSPEVARIHIGPPALSRRTADLTDHEFPAKAYPVLKGHIRAAQRNIVGRAVGHFEPVVWRPGQPPEQPGAFMLQASGSRDIADLLAPLIAPIRALTSELGRKKRLELLPGVFEFIETMRALGIDPDPEDCCLKMAAGAGPPDDLRRRILGRLLAQGMSAARFWWQGQVVDPIDWSPDSTGSTPTNR
jgi:hypothetical protein